MNKDSGLASRLKRRVIIKQPVMTADGSGGFDVEWNDFATVWAEVTPRSAGEGLGGDRIIPVRKLVVVIRYIAGVTSEMRLHLGARVFNIVAVLNPYEENEMLEITAEEEVES